MDIVLLRLLVQLSRLGSSMDHTAIHRNCVCHNVLHQTIVMCLSQRVDAPLREGKIDRPGKIQECDIWVAEIFKV